MANQHNKEITDQRIAAYGVILEHFPSASDMARELALDNRATVGHWKRRGVPVEYIMILDMLGLVQKETLIPAISNWDLMLSKYEQVIKNKLKSIILADSMKKTASATLQTIIGPIIREEVLALFNELKAELRAELDLPEFPEFGEDPEGDEVEDIL